MSDLQTARRIYDEAFDKADFALIDAIMHQDFLQHEGTGSGTASIKAWLTDLREAFPDLRFRLCSSAQGDNGEVWLHGQFTGTHRGVYEGILPTGREVTVSMLDRLRFENGRIVEHWGATDMIGLIGQLSGT